MRHILRIDEAEQLEKELPFLRHTYTLADILHAVRLVSK